MPKIEGLGPAEQSLPEMFFNRAEKMAEAPFVWHRHRGRWAAVSWKRMADQVLTLAAALRQRGITSGTRVAILSENRPEWVAADLAIMLLGAISVPLFTTHSQTDLAWLLAHSGARAVICSDEKLAGRVEAAAQDCPECYLLVVMEPGKLLQYPAGLAVVSLDQMLAEGRQAGSVQPGDFPKLKTGDVACIIYTSGAHEQPKGAMLTHRSIMANLAGAEGLLRDLSLGDEVFLSMLPLSHAYEHSVGLFFPIHISAQIYFLNRPEALTSTLLDVRPTIMTAVPRLYEVLQDRMRQVFRAKGPLQRRMLERAIELGTLAAKAEPLSLGQTIENRLLDLLVRRPIRNRFGGRLKAFVSGGAALDPNSGFFFLALGIRLLQGYGQTEASPVITANPPRAIRIETVGKPLAGVELGLTQSGEIKVRGPLVMAGYWNDPVASRKVLRGGWLYTGDLGTITADGYLMLTGRKKDIIINSGGENISPTKVEAILESGSEIEQAVIFGNRKPFLTALITPSAGLLAQLGKQADPNIGPNAGPNQARLQRRLQEAVDTANASLSPIERIRSFLITDEPFSLDNKCLTASGQIRRAHIARIYGERMEQLYRRNKPTAGTKNPA